MMRGRRRRRVVRVDIYDDDWADVRSSMSTRGTNALLARLVSRTRPVGDRCEVWLSPDLGDDGELAAPGR